jgi:gelsolin
MDITTFEDTNLALFGTDVEKKIRQYSASKETAFFDSDGVAAGYEPGLIVWRVHNVPATFDGAGQELTPPKFGIEPVNYAKSQFFSGDSYLVLKTYINEQKQYKHDIHFWLGKSTTQDEACVAAYKAVELDDLLHLVEENACSCVQHREVQGHESNLFLSYFVALGGFRTLEGGYDTGFHHVGPQLYTARLLRVTNNAIREVPFTSASLNHTCNFILDTGDKLYEWYGKDSSHGDRYRTARVTAAIQQERSRVTIFVVDDEYIPENDEFWTLLGGKVEISSTQESDDSVHGKHELWQLHETSDHTMKFEKINSLDVPCGLECLASYTLDSSCVYIYDFEQIWIWIGKNSTISERRNAFGYAQQYLRDHGENPNVPISIVREGDENGFLDIMKLW